METARGLKGLIRRLARRPEDRPSGVACDVSRYFQNQRRRAAIEQFGASWREYTSLEDFLSEVGPGGTQVATVIINSAPVDVSLEIEPGASRLMVVFNSQQKSNGALRLFTWQRMARSARAHRLYVSDPVLYSSERATIGWYAATSELNFEPIIARLVDGVANALSVESIIYVGSSGGAFPAVLHAQGDGDRMALGLAPSLTIRNFHQKIGLDLWLHECNGAQTVAEVEMRHPSLTVDLGERFAARKVLNSVVILQGVDDSAFVTHSLRPFFERLDCVVEVGRDVSHRGVNLRWGDWGEGHRPPPESEILGAIEAINVWDGPIAEFKPPARRVHG